MLSPLSLSRATVEPQFIRPQKETGKSGRINEGAGLKAVFSEFKQLTTATATATRTLQNSAL